MNLKKIKEKWLRKTKNKKIITMSTIGRIDTKKQILQFLKSYNKSNGKTKKIKKDALERLDRFINIFVKIITVNCVEMLKALKLACLSGTIFYTVYDIAINGNQDFTKETFQRFQNTICLGFMERSKLSFDENTLYTKTFDSNTSFLINNVLMFCGISTKPRINTPGHLIEFILMQIFVATGNSEIITTDILAEVSKLEEFIKLDKCLGSYDILGKDTIEV